MIDIELDICGEEVPAAYTMGAGEIESLHLVIDGEHIEMNELLYINSVSECIYDHYDNLKEEV